MLYTIRIIKDHTARVYKKTKVWAKANKILEELRAQGIRAYCTEREVK